MFSFKKMLLIPSVVALPVAMTVLTSCSTIPNIDESLASQLEALTSENAKQKYYNFWARDAFAQLYLLSKSSPNTDVTSTEFKNNKNLIKESLINLSAIPPTVSVNDGSGNIINGTQMTTEISKDLFNAYHFYTAWKSSSQIDYFLTQQKVWAKNDLSLGAKTIQNDFKPSFGYSSSTTSEVQFKNDFELLYKIIETGIQNELLNMLIAELYFTSTTSEIIQRGTNYNEIIEGNINSLDYWKATSLNINSPTYFLEKYLVEKTPIIKWNFTSENAEKIDNWTNQRIKSPNNYNALWAGELVGTPSSPKKIFSADLQVNSNDSIFNANALNFYGYNSSIELSSTAGVGDLSIDLNKIREFGESYSGLLNSETNKLVSYDSLQKRGKIESLTSLAYLPSINIKPESSVVRKNSQQIQLNDLLIDGQPLPVPQPGNIGVYTIGKNTWKVLEITPILSTQSQQSIEIKMSYSYDDTTDATKSFADYPYEAIVTWQQTASPTQAQISSELEKKFSFTDNPGKSQFEKKQIYGINPIVENIVNVSYYMRLLPQFNWSTTTEGIKNVQEIDGEPRAIGTFSMQGTPWVTTTGTKENIQQLAFSLYMNDAELLTEIKKVLVLNNIAIRPGEIQQVNDILKEFGIIYIDVKPDYAIPKIKQENK